MCVLFPKRARVLRLLRWCGPLPLPPNRTKQNHTQPKGNACGRGGWGLDEKLGRAPTLNSPPSSFGPVALNSHCGARRCPAYPQFACDDGAAATKTSGGGGGCSCHNGVAARFEWRRCACVRV